MAQGVSHPVCSAFTGLAWDGADNFSWQKFTHLSPIGGQTLALSEEGEVWTSNSPVKGIWKRAVTPWCPMNFLRPSDGGWIATSGDRIYVTVNGIVWHHVLNLPTPLTRLRTVFWDGEFFIYTYENWKSAAIIYTRRAGTVERTRTILCFSFHYFDVFRYKGRVYALLTFGESGCAIYRFNGTWECVIDVPLSFLRVPPNVPGPMTGDLILTDRSMLNHWKVTDEELGL